MSDFKQYELEPQPGAGVPVGGANGQLSSLQESGADLVLTRGNIRSRNFTKGQSGWRIDEQGNADFLSTTVIGTPTTSTTVYNLTVVGGSAGVAGSDTQIQFNDSGAFGGDADFVWDKTSNILTLSQSATIQSASGNLNIKGATSTTANGEDVTLRGGDADDAGFTPGDIILRPGVDQSNADRNGIVVAHVAFNHDSGSITDDSYFQIFNGINGSNSRRKTGFHQTTDATVASWGIINLPVNTTYWLEIKVSARRTAGTAGTVGDSAGYKIIGVFKDIAGTVTQVGITNKNVIGEDQAGWDADFSIAGTLVSLDTTGALNNTINWTYEAVYFEHSVG